jgi:hypothetical protein
MITTPHMTENSNQIQSTAQSAVEAVMSRVYDNFFLNDLLSKIVPGFIVLNTIEYLFGDLMRPWFDNLDAYWLISLGLAWALGFLLQATGETFGFIASWPIENYFKSESDSLARKLLGWIHWCPVKPLALYLHGSDRSKWYKDFFSYTPTNDRSKGYLSRFPTIINVVNNLSFSIFFSSSMTLVSRMSDPTFTHRKWDFVVALFILSLLGMIFVTRMHRIRLYQFIKSGNS